MTAMDRTAAACLLILLGSAAAAQQTPPAITPAVTPGELIVEPATLINLPGSAAIDRGTALPSAHWKPVNRCRSTVRAPCPSIDSYRLCGTATVVVPVEALPAASFAVIVIV